MFLFGDDPYTGKNYDHRKPLILNRIKHLTRFFSVKIYGYAIMSNHFHFTVHYDPTECTQWSDEEVARRWVGAFNRLPIEHAHEGPTEVEDFDLEQIARYHDLLLDPQRIKKCRERLGCISQFMQHFKQPLARWMNKEDNCTGHAFEQRYYSGLLLTEEDLLSCMAYVDLNPIEAKIAQSLIQAEDTSIHERLYEERFDASKLDAYLAPLWEDEGESQPDAPPPIQATGQESGEKQSDGGSETSPNKRKSRNALKLNCTLQRYAQQLNLAIIYLTRPGAPFPDQLDNWMARLLNRERKKRAQDPAFFDYA